MKGSLVNEMSVMMLKWVWISAWTSYFRSQYTWIKSEIQYFFFLLVAIKIAWSESIFINFLNIKQNWIFFWCFPASPFEMESKRKKPQFEEELCKTDLSGKERGWSAVPLSHYCKKWLLSEYHGSYFKPYVYPNRASVIVAIYRNYVIISYLAQAAISQERKWHCISVSRCQSI